MSTQPKQPISSHLRWVDQCWIVLPEEGKIISKRHNKEIGAFHNDGHLVVTLCGRSTYVHHIIWWKAKGYWPRLQIDHRDQSKTNNRIDNLFEVTHSEQMKNRTLPYQKV